MVFSDIEILERRIDKTRKLVKGDKKYQIELEFLESLKEYLEAGNSARGYDYTEEEKEIVKDISLLSNKPVIYAANLCEDDFVNNIETNRFYQQVCEIAQAENAAVFPICAKIEEEISDMEQEDKDMFLAELNLTESGLDRIIKASYSLLGLISIGNSPPVRRKCVRGPLQREQKRLRQPEKFILILNGDLSVLRLFHTMI